MADKLAAANAKAVSLIRTLMNQREVDRATIKILTASEAALTKSLLLTTADLVKSDEAFKEHMVECKKVSTHLSMRSWIIRYASLIFFTSS